MWQLLYEWLFPRYSPEVRDARKEDLREAINNHRLHNGLLPIKVCFKLARATQAQATAIKSVAKAEISSHQLVHIFPRTLETDKKGQTVAEVMKAWLNSAEHRALILGNYSRFGFGRAKLVTGEILWVLDFQT